MKTIFFTPGPSQLYPTVKQHITKALDSNILSLSHRSKQFEAIFNHATSGIRTLLKVPQNYHIVFVTSGTEAMERIIQNCVEKYSFHVTNGSFGERFFVTADELQKSPQKYEVEWGKEFVYNDIHIPKQTELICFTQNETITGFAIDMNDIYQYRENYPDALIAVDIVSSAPYVAIDYAQTDCVFFSVQKGFGLPAGLGVIILSPRALEKATYLQKKHYTVGTSHCFPTLVTWAKKNQTMETPNVLGMYLLGKVITDMQKKGIALIRKQQEEKAKLLYDFFDNHKIYKPFITKKQNRSQTVAVIATGENKGILSMLEKNGFIVGEGYGQYKNSYLRIAQFPAHALHDVKNLLEVFKHL